MEYAALAVSVVALMLVLATRSKAAGLSKSVEDAEADARRRIENADAERERELTVLRGQVARLARGADVDPEAVLEGRTWRDASPAEGLRLFTAGRLLAIDVRTPQETAAGIIPGALLIPVDELEERKREIPRDGRTTLVYCASGGRSAAACEFLSREGFEDLVNLDGGFAAWAGPRVTPR